MLIVYTILVNILYYLTTATGFGKKWFLLRCFVLSSPDSGVQVYFFYPLCPAFAGLLSFGPYVCKPLTVFDTLLAE